MLRDMAPVSSDLSRICEETQLKKTITYLEARKMFKSGQGFVVLKITSKINYIYGLQTLHVDVFSKIIYYN